MFIVFVGNDIGVIFLFDVCLFMFIGCDEIVYVCISDGEILCCYVVICFDFSWDCYVFCDLGSCNGFKFNNEVLDDIECIIKVGDKIFFGF